jgi:RNA polymerase sigma-70 factor (ECF subfamily)
LRISITFEIHFCAGTKLNTQTDDIDKTLVERLRNNDQQAFKLLFEKYGARLYQFSLKYLRDKEDAEDLLHEVFLKIWEKRHDIKSNTSFQSYLFTIAYNDICKRFLQKSREEKYIQVFAENYLIEPSLNEDQLDYVQLVQKMNEIVGQLPPRRKEIFNLSYKEELKNSEIAIKLDVSEQFVKNQLSVSRKHIISKFKEDKRFAGTLLLFLFAGQS